MPKVFSAKHWKYFQMIIMIASWWLLVWRCLGPKEWGKKNYSLGSCSMPDWQILLIIQCVHCSAWCGLALVVKEVSGWLKHRGEEVAKPPQILCLRVRHNGSSRRTWLWQSTMGSATAPQLAQRGRTICWLMEGVFPGWSYFCRELLEWSLTTCLLSI